jgi:hypothetical protein
MKGRALIAFTAALGSCCAAFAGGISFTSYCTSFRIGGFTNTAGGMFYTSTYDTNANAPLTWERKTDGTNYILFNLEAKPTASETESNIYQVGYTLYEGDSRVEYGRLVLHIAPSDSNNDNIPDLIQQDRGITNAFTGEAIPNSYLPARRTQPQFSGFLSRSNLAYSGRIVFTNLFDSTITTSRWSILRVGGTMSFTRDSKNRLEYAGGYPYIGNRIDAKRPFRTRFTIVDEDHVLVTGYKMRLRDRTRPRQPDVLYTRRGTEYYATYVIEDGNLDSPFPDFTEVITRLRVSDDADHDGIPDFSDADAWAMP